MRTLEKIDADIEKYRKEYDRKFNDRTEKREWGDFMKWAEPEIKALSELSRERRMIMPYKLSDIPDYADVMTLKDFIDCVNSGVFIDYDGSGNYCINGKETDIQILPSDVEHNAIRHEFDSVAWYNK